MKKINYLLFIVLYSSCIERYVPKIKTTDVNKYVVSGQITNLEGYHIISVSKTSPVNDPEFIPVSNCEINIVDNNGNTFSLIEFEDGKYRVWIDQAYLNPGTSYRLNIVTPEGMLLESDYDKMPECPQLDSVYYFKEEPPYTYSNPNFTDTEGIKFYLNFTGNNTDSRFLRWGLVETWEFHSAAILHQFIDGNGLHILEKPDSSRYVCWKTETVKEVFALSTRNLTQNMYKKFPVNYVDNHSQRLKYGYSLLVNQFALSEEAFTYWEQLRINSAELGGLYEKQPLPIIGNITNITNPEQRILGFFEASSVKSKRLFVSNVEDFTLQFITFCALEIPSFSNSEFSNPPIYITTIKGINYNMNRECWDCMRRGGKVVKPDFWPN